MERDQSVVPPSYVAIEVVVKAWARAWNNHDMEAAAVLFTPDADFVNVAGCWLKGKQEFLRHHGALHRLQMRASVWTNLAHEIRFISHDLAIVHLEWTLAGDYDADGTPRKRRHGVFTWLLSQVEKDWRIVVAHNTDLRPGVMRRLEASARKSAGM